MGAEHPRQGANQTGSDPNPEPQTVQDNEGMGTEHPRQGANVLRPPAMVTEYMSQGSLKTALSRKADVVQGAMHRLCIAMDAAKARARTGPASSS